MHMPIRIHARTIARFLTPLCLSVIAQTFAAERTASSNHIEDIVVTARHRDEASQQVPIPITAIITFEDMLERTHAHAKTFHHAQERQDLILAIAMTMNKPLASDDLAEGFQFEIATGWNTAFDRVIRPRV